MTETLTPQRRIAKPHTLPRKVTVADVLERAADLLGEFGWCQGENGSKQSGKMCLRGAIIEAHFDLTGERLEEYGDSRVLRYEDIAGVGWVWNDKYDRTKAEVISALRAAASSARTKEEA